MNTTRLALVPMLAWLTVGSAHAVPITVDYTAPALTDVLCFASPEICAGLAETIDDLPPQEPHTATFDIDETQRAADGSYDVSATLGGSLLAAFQESLESVANAGMVATPSTTATAVTQGGLVQDLLLTLAFNAIGGGASFDFSFVAAGGSYVLSNRLVVELSDVTHLFGGTYTITQPPADPGPGPVPVPEPRTWLLMAIGLGLLLSRARCRPVHRARGDARKYTEYD